LDWAKAAMQARIVIKNIKNSFFIKRSLKQLPYKNTDAECVAPKSVPYYNLPEEKYLARNHVFS
jgi:hypothetical protein